MLPILNLDLGLPLVYGEKIASQLTKDSVAGLSTRLSGTALASSKGEVQSRAPEIEKEAEVLTARSEGTYRRRGQFSGHHYQ